MTVWTDGKEIEQIDVPRGSALDVTFGGKDRDLLFIIGINYVRTQNEVKGAD